MSNNYSILEYSRLAPYEAYPRSWKNDEKMREVAILAARKGLIDCVDFLAERMSFFYRHLSAFKKFDRVYCYLGMKSYRDKFKAFCSAENNAKELSKVIGRDYYRKLKEDSERYSSDIVNLYPLCWDLLPTDIFIIIDLAENKIRCFETILPENIRDGLSNDDHTKRFNAWFRAHGGNPKPVGPGTDNVVSKFEFWLESSMLGKNDQVNYPNPADDAVELNLETIRREVELALEAEAAEENIPEKSTAKEEHSALLKSLDSGHGAEKDFGFDVAYDYLEGDTGFLAIKAAFDERYTEESCFDILYFQTVDDLRDEYNLPRKEYQYTLYENIAVYDAGDSWHIISLGMSELGAERDDMYKRYDAEYTMRIPKLDDEDMDEAERANAINLVSILADEACNKERMAEDYSYVSLGFRKGMDYKRESDKVAFIIVPDARIGSVEGPFGTVHLRQAVPITRAEHQALKAKQIDVKTLYEKIGTDLTDYSRPSVI